MGSPQPSDDALIGRSIGGKYEIVSFVGRGGMGAVFKAKQAHLKRPVAIKVLHPEHSRDGTYAGRFRREAQQASRLDHPNLMRVLDFGQEPDGLLYLAMEFLDGRDLLQVLREEGVLAPERIVDILSQTLSALAAAHDEGIVHRDLKPENIMIVRGKDDDGSPVDLVKVCDFGIAKTVDVAPKDHGVDGEPTGLQTYTATLTATGALVGTPEYMSPEQAKGEKLDPRSDIYSMGIILYLMLTGKLPFQSANSMKVVLKHVSEKPKPPSEVRKNVDPHLEAVCLKALEKDRDDRFANARDMRAALRVAVGMRDTAGGNGRYSTSTMPPPLQRTSSSPPEGEPKLGSPSEPPRFDKDASTLVDPPSNPPKDGPAVAGPSVPPTPEEARGSTKTATAPSRSSAKVPVQPASEKKLDTKPKTPSVKPAPSKTGAGMPGAETEVTKQRNTMMPVLLGVIAVLLVMVIALLLRGR